MKVISVVPRGHNVFHTVIAIYLEFIKEPVIVTIYNKKIELVKIPINTAFNLNQVISPIKV